MTAHDPALQPPRKRRLSNIALFTLATKCQDREEKGFRKAEAAAVKLLQRATSSHPKADEARRLLKKLTPAQRQLFDLPTFLFEDEANA